MDYNQITFIINGFLIFLIILLTSVQTGRILPISLFLSFINLLITIITYFIYDNYIIINELNNKIYLIYQYANVFILFLIILIYIYNSLQKNNQYNLFVSAIKENDWNAYIYINKKFKVKEISNSLLEQIGLTNKEVIRKNIFRVFDKSIRFYQLNDEEITNKKLEDIYLELKNSVKKKQYIKQELSFSNYLGKEIFLNIVLQPLFIFNKFKGFIMLGEIKSNFDLIEIEKDLINKSSNLESLTHKLIALFEVSEEGLYSIDLNERTIWLSDSLKSFLNIKASIMELVDFRRFIESEDLTKQQNLISKLTKENPFYNIKIRIYAKNQYIWFQDKGKRIYEDENNAIILGSLNPIAIASFEKTGLDLIDQVKDDIDLVPYLTELHSRGRYYHLIITNLTNIPNINEDHGRSIGSMMIMEHLKYIKDTFISKENPVFRLSGLMFAFVMTDARKIQVLKQHMDTHNEFLNMNLKYGSLDIKLDVHMGAAISTDEKEVSKLLERAKQALNFAMNPKYIGNACYYSDIR